MPTTLHINTLFRWCNDIPAMRHFYTDLLDMDETFFRDDDDHGWLSYDAGGVHLVFMRGSSPLPVATDWAAQPGYTGGTGENASWLLTTPDEAAFKAIVDRLKKAEDVPVFSGDLDRSRQCIVQDPMGYTVEISTETPSE